MRLTGLLNRAGDRAHAGHRRGGALLAGETFGGVYPERSRGNIWANLKTISALSGYNGCTQENLSVGVETNNRLQE